MRKNSPLPHCARMGGMKERNPSPFRGAHSTKGRIKQQELVIYRDERGEVKLKADMDKETIWATLDQIAALFDVQKAAVSKHFKNIFETSELTRHATVSKMETVQDEGGRSVRRAIEFYNLDGILAVGYRVNSKQATNFRRWATKTLRDYIIKGYAVNERRLKESRQTSVKELQKTLRFIQGTIRKRQLDQSEVDSLLSVISDYANSWLLLEQYDEGKLTIRKGTEKEKRRLEYLFTRPAIDELKQNLAKKGEASDLFGAERDGTFQGILKTIYQTFGGRELYGSLEEKAAHLLYFIIKDHPFSDGNKRIGSFLFILFLKRNGILFRTSGEKKIQDTTLVALALLVAESDPTDKESMVALITNLLA